MRILIANPFGIGDVLFSTPLISILRENYPEGYIGYICNKRTKEALLTNPNLDEIFVFEKDDYRRLWRQSKIRFIKEFFSFLMKIKRKRFEVAFDLSLSRHYSFFLRLTGIPKRIGFNYKNRARFLTHKIDLKAGYTDKHVVEYYLDLLSFLGIKPKLKSGLQLLLSEDDKVWAEEFLKDSQIDNEIIIGIVPGGGASWGKDAFYKHWPEEKFAEVCDELIKRFKAKIIILGSSSEVEKCKNIMNLMKNKPIIACGKTSLRQFGSLLGKCKLVICNDGGPLHIAVSQGTKTISIFGPVNEKVYGPYPLSSDHIVIKKDIGCRPCYRRFRIPKCENLDCLKKITSKEVLEAAEKILYSENQSHLRSGTR